MSEYYLIRPTIISYVLKPSPPSSFISFDRGSNCLLEFFLRFTTLGSFTLIRDDFPTRDAAVAFLPCLTRIHYLNNLLPITLILLQLIIKYSNNKEKVPSNRWYILYTQVFNNLLLN